MYVLNAFTLQLETSKKLQRNSTDHSVLSCGWLFTCYSKTKPKLKKTANDLYVSFRITQQQTSIRMPEKMTFEMNFVHVIFVFF